MAEALADLLARREDLTNQIAELDTQIEDARRAKQQDTLKQVHSLLADAGLTVADLGKSAAAAPKKGAPKGTKVPVKYRDPISGATWSGRGIKPKWMAEAVASGKKPEDFAI